MQAKINIEKIVNVKTIEISDEEKQNNAVRALLMNIGTIYEFKPCINASGIPKNTNLNGLPDFDFQFGKYLGEQDDRLVFEGYPIDAPEETKEWEFFFFVSFVEGSGISVTPTKK